MDNSEKQRKAHGPLSGGHSGVGYSKTDKDGGTEQCFDDSRRAEELRQVICWLDNVPGEQMIRAPDGPLIPASEYKAAEAEPEPEDAGGDDWGALERELEEIADLLNNGEKAESGEAPTEEER